MTTEEQRFLKNIVQRSGIRRGLPNTVLGFDSNGKPQATLKSSLGGGGVERENVADPFNDWWIYDEFFYPTPSSHFPNWETFGSVSTVAINIGGVVQTSTNTVINNVGGFKVCAGGLTAVDFSKVVKLIWRVRNRSGGADIAERVGFLNGQGANPSGTFPYGNENSDVAQRPHAYFGHDGTGNWRTLSQDNGGTVQDTDTGVPVDSNFITLQIEVDPVVPSLIWTINNVLVKTQTTDLPTGNLAIGVAVQTASTSTKQMEVDSCFLYSKR